MSAIAVEGLAVSLGGRPVLHDVDLTVAGRELVGLVGPNGAGKTTLLRALLGLVRPAAGTITVAGARTGRRRRRGIGYVPQRHEVAWDFPISVEQMVLTGRTGLLGLGRRAGVEDWTAVADALARVHLADLRRRPVGELSGGQRQRVLVARALAVRPAALLLDEPYTALDMPTQELLAGLFAGLAADGTAVLMTTHDLLGALGSCTRLVLLNRTVVAEGPPARLRDPEPWMRTFGVGEASPLVTILRVA
ncbi:MAG TPA: anchored repeat-type ABC transporter ATP-binding subunit [Iamia sp.]|nr:anchored repeat-type ABC transporter ATP-binding subunit [Iamia sp.]